jgi:MFS family permease
MIASVFGGGLGVVTGGWLSDRLKQRSPIGRLHVLLAGLLLEIPTALGFLFAPVPGVAYALAIGFNVASTLWVGSANAAITELVLPRMRALATAALLTMYTFVGLALGPYAVGRISDALGAGGMPAPAALRSGLALGLLVLLPAAALLLRAMRSLASDEATVEQRARLAAPGA